MQSDRVLCEVLAEAEETVDDVQVTTKTVLSAVAYPGIFFEGGFNKFI
jgi:hypothetical protein